MKYLGRYIGKILGRVLTGIIYNVLPTCAKALSISWHKNLNNYVQEDGVDYIKDSIGTRTDEVFYGQYLDATSGQVNFYRTSGTFSYVDPSDGSTVSGVSIPGTGLYTIPANGICDITVDVDSADVPITNAGATGTTDWDNSGGTPTGWANEGDPATLTVENPVAGFTGNVFKVVSGGGNALDLKSSNTTVEVGKTYKLRFKYDLTGVTGSLEINQALSAEPIPITTGVETFESASFTTIGTTLNFYIYTNGGQTLYIDEVELIDQEILIPSYYPVCERAGTVLHDVSENSFHISVDSPSWAETLYGSDYLNQYGYVDKTDSDAEGYDWETEVNNTNISLNNNTLIPLSQWVYVNLIDSEGETITDINGEVLQVKQNL